MSSRTVIDGNAFYEIDEECLKKKQSEEEKKRRMKAGRSGEVRKREKGD